MKKQYIYLLLLVCLLNTIATDAQNHWQQVDASRLPATKRFSRAVKYLAYTTDEAALRSTLFGLSKVPAEGSIIELPIPDGTMRSFKIWHSPMMPDQLAAKYPELRTFTGEAVDNPNVTAKLDFTVYGFHAMINDGQNVSFIDPVDNTKSGNYMVHYKKDEISAAENRMNCMVKQIVNGVTGTKSSTKRSTSRTENGYQLRSYRLALACDHFYADSATGLSNPTKSQVLSKMVTSMNRINGVYERELSITMNLVANEDTIIFTTEAGDPYSSDNAIPGNLCNDNQVVCDTRIGDANYDIGHVFTTGAGGLSQVGVVCQSSQKALSATGRNNPIGDGFDIDYVAHEMGHEFGASHPFNNGTDHSCGGGNRYQPASYEPGSGSTIMAYAGICSPDDLQPHSDAYFHSVSLQEIQSYISTTGDGCAVKTPTNNKLLSLPAFSYSYTIPYLTPFELTAPAATDSVADTSVTYCWEEWDVGDTDVQDYGLELANTTNIGPIFRSYSPTSSPKRIFPQNSMVLAGVLSNAGTEDNEGEKAPDVARFLTFKLTLRDIYQGYGCFLIPADSILLDIIDNGTGAGFAVTSQNDSASIYIGNSSMNITWNVAGTDQIPVNTPNVDIYISRDGGNTWHDTIGNFPNNGSATIKLLNPDTTVTNARIKIKGTDNVFFNVNRYNFSILHSEGADTSVNITLLPVPAHNTISISSGNKGLLQIEIYNAVGQRIWSGQINGEMDIPVSLWGRGLYIMKATDDKNQRTVKKFVLD